MLRNTFTPPCGFDLATTTVTGAPLGDIAYWGYRLVVHPDGTCFVHETYYDRREGVLGIAREPARPCGSEPGDVLDELHRMEEGISEPALRFRDYAAEPASSEGDGTSGEVPEVG
ncbi:hypothetical protein [Rubrivirga sp. IMCC45206]|uniref:hypothetical protein n=1 Tax=Rubrivirga sp. IMCC45206 TaxID=3391614 RepID=UPI00398FA939